MDKGGPSKRNRELDSSTEEERKTFAKSKKIVRTPEKANWKKTYTEGQTREEKENMEEMKAMMSEMMQQMQLNIEENRRLREEMKKDNEKWKEERKQLTDRIDKLEERIEAMDREKRKCNIIIKGLLPKNPTTKETVANLLEEKLGEKVHIKKVSTISIREDGSAVTLAEMETWEDKQIVMRNKNKMKNTRIYIEHDQTLEERRIAVEIRKIARNERMKGHAVKIGYKKISIQGENYRWSKNEDALVADTKN